jgi:sugar O-acyltransferase (sialic acid O-acetyltransferase NeuD family)
VNSVLILGAGGHAKVVADTLRSQGTAIQGFLDDKPALWGSSLMGYPIWGGISQYSQFEANTFIIGVGNNHIRAAISEAYPLAWITAVHDKATLSPDAQLGAGSLMAAGAILNPDTVVGRHVIINTNATIDHDCQIDDYAHIAPGATLGGGVQVGRLSLIGIGATVMPYCTIGDSSIIGAGTLVTKDIPAGVVAMGVPAQIVKDTFS